MCCGRGNITASPTRTMQHQQTVGDNVPTFMWQWKSFDPNGVKHDPFPSEKEARAWIAAGNPGTLTVVST
jgi:hypothetical protein